MTSSPRSVCGGARFQSASSLTLALWLALAATPVLGSCSYDLDRIPAPGPVPQRPRGAPEGSSVSFTVVLHNIDLGKREGEGNEAGPRGRFTDLGLNLDGVVTQDGGRTSCQLPPWLPAHRDGTGGVDNTAGYLPFAANRYLDYSLSDTINLLIDSGGAGSGLAVSDYNGKSNDAEVQVRWLPLAGSFSPRWEGQDVWTPFSTDEPNEQLKEPADLVDRRAYVRDGQLVAWFPTVLVGPWRLLRVWLVADLVQSSTGWSLRDGVVGGRLRLDDALASLDYAAEQRGAPLCTNSDDYLEHATLVCATADLNSEGIDDGSAPCDAAAFGMGFDAVSIQLGAEVPWVPPTPVACPDPALRPSADTCANHAT